MYFKWNYQWHCSSSLVFIEKNLSAFRVNDELICPPNTTQAIKGVVNCQNSQDKGPPEGNSARG